MSPPIVSGNAVPQTNDAASAEDASCSSSRKQSAWVSSILTIVLITVVLAAAVAIVVATFLYWAPQARSWSFPITDFSPQNQKPHGDLSLPKSHASHAFENTSGSSGLSDPGLSDPAPREFPLPRPPTPPFDDAWLHHSFRKYVQSHAYDIFGGSSADESAEDHTATESYETLAQPAPAPLEPHPSRSYKETSPGFSGLFDPVPGEFPAFRPSTPPFDEAALHESFRKYVQSHGLGSSGGSPADESTEDHTATESAEPEETFSASSGSTPFEPPGTPPFPPDDSSVGTPAAHSSGNPPDDSATDRLMTAQETPPESYVQGYKSLRYPRLRFLLHGPSPTDLEQKTAIYETGPQRNFCAVSAGNSDLTLSRPVADLLVSAVEGTPDSMSVEELNASVAAAHASAASRARQQPGTVIAVTLKDHPVYSKLFALMPVLPGWEAKEFGDHASLVVLGIFKPPFYPHGDPANRFHLYAVPPYQTSGTAFFFRSYKNTYRNCLKLVDIYNGRNVYAQIKQLRLFLLRHGPHSGPDQNLAKAAISAILLYASRNPLSFALDLPYDSANTFFYQLRTALSPDSQRSPIDRGSMESLHSSRS